MPQVADDSPRPTPDLRTGHVVFLDIASYSTGTVERVTTTAPAPPAQPLVVTLNWR